MPSFTLDPLNMHPLPWERTDMKNIAIILTTFVILMVVVFSIIMGAMGWNFADEAYYSGVFDSCMAVAGYAVSTVRSPTSQDYEYAYSWCTALTDNAREQNRFRNRPDFPAPGDDSLY